MTPAELATITAALTALVAAIGKIGYDWQVARNARSDAKRAEEQSVTELGLRLHESLSASEKQFRDAVYAAWVKAVEQNQQLTAHIYEQDKKLSDQEETIENQARQIDEQAKRLTVVTEQLTFITLDRDAERRRADRLEAELAAANRRIAALQRQVALLEGRPDAT